MQIRRPNGKFGGRMPEIDDSDIMRITTIWEAPEPEPVEEPARESYSRDDILTWMALAFLAGAVLVLAYF